MRAKLRPFILASLACAQLGPTAAWSAGRPTHTLTRDNRRLVLPAPSHPSQRARATHPTQHHMPVHGHAAGAKAAQIARHMLPDLHHGRHSGHHQAATAHLTPAPIERRTQAHESEAQDHSAPGTAADNATVERVHAWEEAQHRQAVSSTPSGPTSAEQALQAAGAQIAATEITPAETMSSTLPPISRAELPRVLSIEQEAATPVLLPSLYDKRGHLVVPPPIYGSHDVLLHQNLMADRDGLTRVRDDEDLTDLRRQHKLVPLPESEALHVDDRLPANRRYSRPWTAVFLAVLARDFYASFHEPLQLTSAVRTVQIQQRLLRTNGNAAPIAGDTASPHLTGQAVDIGKRGLSTAQIAWMRAYLEPLIEQGKIDVEEEFRQSCFHISVYRSYTIPLRESLATTGLTHAAGTY